MASLVKKCRHKRPEWDTCGCQWLIRSRVGGRDTYTPVGTDRERAERALVRHDAGAEETVGQALDAWLAAKKREPDARANSLASYRGRVGHVRAALGHVPLRSLRSDDLTGFVDDLLVEGYAPATVQGIYAALTSTLRHAQRRGVIRHLPLPPDGPGIPEVRPRRHDLSLEQIEDVIARMPGVWGRVAELVLLTGLRWGEVVALRPEDIRDGFAHVRRTRTREGGVNPPKTRQGQRVVPLSARARKVADDLPLPIEQDYRRAHEALVHAMGDLHRPGMGWHTIRNAHATLLDRAGYSLRDSAARMGHGTSYAQTLQYGLVTEAGSADVLDRVRRHARPSSSDPSAAPGDVVPLSRARRKRAR